MNDRCASPDNSAAKLRDRLFSALAGLYRVGVAVSGGPDSTALLYLAASVQRRSRRRPQQRTRLYRMVEFVGRWSMLDIYVITLLVALVQFQGLATIQAGPAAVAFGAVVVLTMFAAMSFDPRLIWDPIAGPAPSDDHRHD